MKEEKLKRLRAAGRLKSKCEPAADAARLLGEDQQRTIAQEDGTVALGKHVPDIEQRH